MVKAFTDLSENEVLALTDEQIQHYVDLACAEAGVPLLPPDPGPKPERPDAKPDVTVYVVDGITLRTMADAEKVRDLLNAMDCAETKYVSGPRYEKTVVPAEPCSIKTETHYSAENWECVKDAMNAYGEAKKAHDKATDEYRKASTARAEATEWIHERIGKARDNQWNRDRYAADFARYVTLADGDEKVAYRFLLNAHPAAADFVDAPEGYEAEKVEAA